MYFEGKGKECGWRRREKRKVKRVKNNIMKAAEGSVESENCTPRNISDRPRGHELVHEGI